MAVMDSEESFNKRQVVPGGYLFATVTAKGLYVFHIYGLKNGIYSMLSFIDNNKNSKPDFAKPPNAGEKYATFSDHSFANEKELTFSGTSADFTKNNSKVMVKWKQ